jgi:Tn3 transposase DDE domain
MVTPHDKSAAEAKMRESTDRLVQHYPGMIENLLKLRSRFVPLTSSQIGLAPHKNWIHGGPIGGQFVDSPSS